MLHLELPQAEGVRSARKAVAELIPEFRAIDRADIMVLVSELVAAVSADPSSTVALDVWRTDEGLRVEAHGESVPESLDPLATVVFEEIASDWFIAEQTAGFEVNRTYAFSADEDEAALFKRSAMGEPTAREELTKRYEGFARSIARRFDQSRQRRDDLEQVAAVGLVNALERFDLSRGVKFTTFAARTIDGELKRYLRDSGWSLRVPRRLQELGLEANRAATRESQKRGRQPTLDEIASAVDADPQEVGQALLARRSFDAASLDAPMGGEETLSLLHALPSHDERLLLAPEWSDLSMVMDRLPLREQQILFLRFFRDLSQSEIADIVGISQMHVSRLLARSIADLRAWLDVDPTET